MLCPLREEIANDATEEPCTEDKVTDGIAEESSQKDEGAEEPSNESKVAVNVDEKPSQERDQTDNISKGSSQKNEGANGASKKKEASGSQ